MSKPAPCGRAAPAKSVVTPETAAPASIAGLPAARWKSWPPGLTIFGSTLTFSLVSLQPAGSEAKIPTLPPAL